ncbi:Inorganic triphosphatase [Halomicronema hongdechloris C2206]|uniref:Inorganic triphosphatase n=2 Tax=Halomicronema hongdechloris TaxID=1209493 RepID=A0A1Z3HH59_9CYAN|nr:Inorganic triphosphatase [Halomicronema hongdechloris C2206]
MAQEIERKFLVTGDGWRSQGQRVLYRQGYIPTTDARTVRIRVVGQQGYLTLKGPTAGVTRSEFEYPIPHDEAMAILDILCDPPLIEKWRTRIELEDLIWQIDEFLGANQGLILAEVELTQENQTLQYPSWLGPEVSHDPRYFNVNLARHPYTAWSDAAT